MDHPGFPPKYWRLLVEAALEMSKAEACSDCMLKWRNHGPAHYRAFKNVETCPECAVRTVMPVERAIFDWQYNHDPLRPAVKKLLDAYREKKGTKAPSEEDFSGIKEFWSALADLDNLVSKGAKET